MRKPNKYGCVPSGDVCLKHCEPLINKHGCSEQQKQIKNSISANSDHIADADKMVGGK